MPQPVPIVSVVIPARNEARFIRACIESVRALDTAERPLEIIVADNGSIDETAQIAASAGTRVVSRPGVLVGAVRNAGAEVASGEFVAFIDGDCLAGPGWIEAAIARLADAQVGAVGGGYLPNPHGSWAERAWADSTPLPASSTRALPGGSIIMRRDQFVAIGRFNESLSAGEDDELCARVRKLGLSVVSLPECYVTHLGYPSNLRDVATRQVWHGSHQLFVAESPFERQLMLTHGFLFGLALAPSGLFTGSRAALILSTALLFGPTALLAWSKARGRKDPIVVFTQMLPIGFFFYFGRAWGLVLNYLAIARRARPSRS